MIAAPSTRATSVEFNDIVSQQRLAKVVKRSYRELGGFRNLRMSLVEEFAGPGYTHGGREGQRDQYLNLINQAVEAYTMVLASNRPQVLISTHREKHQQFAQHFQKALNKLFDEIHLGDTLREWLIDSFFSIGIIKVHLADSELQEVEHNVFMDPGIPFASNISLDNFVYDTSASTWGECKFMGDMYRISWEEFQEGDYDKKNAKWMRPTSKVSDEEETVREISLGQATDEDEFEPMVDLCDLYFPKLKKIMTFGVESRRQFEIKGGPLMTMDWTGGEGGNYHILGFTKVPENIMPSSLADQLSPMSRLANNLMRKQARQASRQKETHAFPSSSADDARRWKSASDGGIFHANEPERIKTLVSGGANPNNQMFLGNTIDMFDRMAGNLTAMLGLGKQSGTVGQEQLIHNASGRKETYMQSIFVEKVRHLVKDLGKLLWDDEFKEIPGSMQIPGAEWLVADMTWYPGDRQGDFEDYDFNIDVYTMAYQSPSQRVGGLVQVVTQVFAPLLPMLQQQGGTIDMNKLSDIMAEMMNEPRLREVIKFQMPEMDPTGGNGGPSKPPMSSREYVRRNVSEGDGASDMMSGWDMAPQTSGDA